MKQLFKHDDKLFLVLRDMNSSNFHNKTGEFLNDKLIAWKQFLGAEHVLKVEDRFLFVEEIKEHEFQDLNIEENENSN